METILLTGGAGFIGSHAARKLVQRGCKVVVFDSFTYYVSPFESRYQNILEHRYRDLLDGVEIVRGDTRNLKHLSRVIEKFRPDRIVHLAALPIADLSNVYSEEAMESILLGAINALEIIRDVDFVRRFVYISSSMIYGDFEYEPADEDHPRNPKEVYGGMKCCGEILTQAFSRRFGLEYTIVRPSAVYGFGDINRRVSQIFVENALLGKDLLLHHGGQSRLDFTYVEDAAEGIVLAALSDQAANQVFNITRGQGRSIREFAEAVKAQVPSANIVISEENEVFRPKRGSMDISRARELLGYDPKYSVEEGVKLYVEQMRGLLQCEKP